MAKDIVFVLHGIGEYQDDWLANKMGAVPALKEAAKQYPFFQTSPLESHVEFVPVLYDDIFVRIMKNWADQAEALKESIPIMPGLADKVLTFLQDLDENDWEKTFAADVVLYWGFRLFQQRVSLRVIKQIVDKVSQTATLNNEVPDYHILAHSLGTAVAQDALHHLGTENWLEGLATRAAIETDAEIKVEQTALLEAIQKLRDDFGTTNPFDPGLFSFESITMISNVSGLIYSNDGPATSIVRPGTASEHGAYTKRYINVNHVADPVSIATNFKAPGDWELTGGLTDLSFTHLIQNDDIKNVKDVATLIHSAAHYVAHPNLHLRLLTMYVNPYRPTVDDRTASRSFANKYGPAKIRADIKQAYKDLKSGDKKGLDKIVDVIKSIKDMING
jgi:hypothetical protein